MKKILMLVKPLLLVGFFVITSGVSFSQSIEQLNEDAHDFYEYDQFEKARELFEQLDSLEPNNGDHNYYLGMCWMHSEHQERALDYLKKARDLNFEADVAPELYKNEHGEWVSEDLDFNLARCLHLNHEFAEAIEEYEAFKAKILKKHNHETKQDHHDILIIDGFVENAKNGIELKKNPVKADIVHLGEGINSEYPEYGPVVTTDESTIFFTSRRPNTTGGKRDPLDETQWMEDIYYSEKNANGEWGDAKLLHVNVNTNEHDAVIGISPDGQRMFIYKNAHKFKDGGDIYVSELDHDEWSVPRKMDENINGKHSWEGSASITSNGNILFFASDREGGFGGKDIYMSKKMPDGKWGKAINLGPSINTKEDEDAPFIHSDGATFYFSSKGHNSMGGYDIYKSTMIEATNEFSKAENLGYPINSANDDIFFVFSADGKRAYFASHHKDSYGDEDIYVMNLHPKEEVSLIVLKGKVIASDNNQPLKAQVTVIDNATGDTVGTYSTNTKTGKYTVILPPGKNYAVSVTSDTYIPHSENIDLPETGQYYEKELDVALNPIIAGSVTVLRNVFFDTDKSKLRPESHGELDRYVQLLKSNTKLFVEIAGHTDSVGSAKYNVKLSQARARSVMDYLSKKGIPKSRMIATGYGEDHPIATNKTVEGRQSNRRTEIILHDEEKEGHWDDWEKWKEKHGHYSKK